METLFRSIKLLQITEVFWLGNVSLNSLETKPHLGQL